MSNVTTIAFGRNMKVFAVKETVPGTLVIPASANMILCNSGELKVPNPAFEDDKGVRGSRSDFKRYKTHTPESSFKLAHYLRPSGSVGVAPEADPVLESVHGTKTIVGGTSVAYTPADAQASISLYVKKGHTVFAGAGCVAEKLGLKKDNKSILEASVDGKVMKVIWTGTDALGIAITTTPAQGTEEEFAVVDPKKYCTGSHVLIDTEQMQITGTAWEGTAAAGKIKFKRGHNASAVATHLISAPITPWLPAGTETGDAIAARPGTLTIDAVTLPFLDHDYNFDSGVAMNVDEVTGVDTPTDYFEGDRKVSGKISMYFRKDDLKWFADAILQTRKAVVINYGSVAGKMVRITLPYCEFDMPPVSGDKEVQKIELAYKAYASAGNDEAELKFL